jgi:hypothetical protein
MVLRIAFRLQRAVLYVRKEMEREIVIYISQILHFHQWIAGTLVVAAMAQLVVALVS